MHDRQGAAAPGRNEYYYTRTLQKGSIAGETVEHVAASCGLHGNNCRKMKRKQCALVRPCNRQNRRSAAEARLIAFCRRSARNAEKPTEEKEAL